MPSISMNATDLEKACEEFLQSLLRNDKVDPQMKQYIAQNKEDLIHTLKDLMLVKNPYMSKVDLGKKEVIQELTAALVVAITLQQQDPALKKALMDDMKLAFQKVGLIDAVGQPNPNKKMSDLTPQETAQLKADLSAVFEKLGESLEKNGILKLEPRPDGAKKPEDEMAEKMLEDLKAMKSEDEKFAYLYNIVGNTPFTTSYFVGNLMGFPDFAYTGEGMTNMDRSNNPFASEVVGTNFLSLGSILSEEIVKDLSGADCAVPEHNTFRPQPPGTDVK